MVLWILLAGLSHPEQPLVPEKQNVLTRFERLNRVENIVSLYIVFCGGLEKETSTAPKAPGCQNGLCSRPESLGGRSTRVFSADEVDSHPELRRGVAYE
jgi:hypothetical protein